MTRLNWDLNGRPFEVGLDLGVLYTDEGVGVPWNGLVSVEDNQSDASGTPLYIDGIKYTTYRLEGDYSARLKAFMYPDEFMEYEGQVESAPGLFLTDQPVYKTFGLCYRTIIGNAVYGIGVGYKLHILYNLTAVPQSHNHETLSDSNDLADFVWDISGVPEEVPGYRPTAHFVVDSRKVPLTFLSVLESILYGDSDSAARLPSPAEIKRLYSLGLTSVIDNGDGTVAITGPSSHVFYTGTNTFTVTADGVTPLGNGEYEITDGEE